MKVMSRIITALLILATFHTMAKGKVSDPKQITIDLHPSRIIPLLVQYHFKDKLEFYNTYTSIWFSKPNHVIVNIEVYEHDLEKARKTNKSFASQKTIITLAKNRMEKLITRIIKKLKMIPQQVNIKYQVTKIPQYDFKRRDWLNIKTEDL